MVEQISSRKLVNEALNLKATFSKTKFAQFLSEGFGDEKGLADKLADTYQLAAEGSATRKSILDLVLTTLLDVSDQSEALQMMSQNELSAEAEELLAKLDRARTSTVA